MYIPDWKKGMNMDDTETSKTEVVFRYPTNKNFNLQFHLINVIKSKRETLVL